MRALMVMIAATATLLSTSMMHSNRVKEASLEATRLQAFPLPLPEPAGESMESEHPVSNGDSGRQVTPKDQEKEDEV